jgi:hypothetical protein
LTTSGNQSRSFDAAPPKGRSVKADCSQSQHSNAAYRDAARIGSGQQAGLHRQ